MYHKIKDDQGVVLCADAAPVAGKNVGDVIWAELTAMLQGRDTDKAAYAIRQLDQMSGGGVLFDNLSDFDRREVVDRVKGLMVHRDEAIAQAAVRVVGTHNPYMSAERTLHWLATVGSATVPGVGKMDPHMQNVGAKMCEDELTAVTRGTGSNETRGLAIRALGLVGDRALLGPIERWLADRSPDVRAAATVLLADFPGAETRRRLTALAGDPAPEVRAAVAEAAGFAQEAGLADVLAGLLGDRERKVREAAAMSLLSFSPDDETIAAIFRANLDDEEFEPLFLLALAREEPGDYLDGLAGAVEQKTEPESFWGGQIPAFTAWEILFRFLQAQPVEEVTSGRLDRYLDAMEKVGNYSSSPPRDIYAFYLQRGMTARAQAFRKKAAAEASYDLDYFFNMVDENPGLYTRQ
jgi:hypothetical protein